MQNEADRALEYRECSDRLAQIIADKQVDLDKLEKLEDQVLRDRQQTLMLLVLAEVDDDAREARVHKLDRTLREKLQVSYSQTAKLELTFI